MRPRISNIINSRIKKGNQRNKCSKKRQSRNEWKWGTFSNIQNPDENRGGDEAKEEHSDLLAAGELADPKEQPLLLLLLEHLWSLPCSPVLMYLFIQRPITSRTNSNTQWSRHLCPSSHSSHQFPIAPSPIPHSHTPNSNNGKNKQW